MMQDQPRPIIVGTIEGPISRKLRAAHFFKIDKHITGEYAGQFEVILLNGSDSIFLTADELRAFAEELKDEADGYRELAEKRVPSSNGA